MHLSTLWFLVDGIFWIGFFILEGFDFGVGMLHSFVAKDETERRPEQQRSAQGRAAAKARQRRPVEAG